MFGRDMFLFLLTSYSIWLLSRVFSLVRRRKAVVLTNELILQLFVIYFSAVIFLTMSPFSFQVPMIGPRAFSFDNQLFYKLRHMSDGYLHLQLLYSVVNILMFIPFGMLAPFTFKKLRSFIWLVVVGFLFSLSIELTQGLFTLTRRATVDDLVLNTVGAILGYFIFITLSSKRRFRK